MASAADPLAPPRDARLLRRYCRMMRIDARRTPRMLLDQVIGTFSRLPYENLTKIIKDASTSAPGDARRSPEEVLADHVRLGAGGTCFSLAATLLHLIRTLGFRAAPILANRSYGENTHCAILVWLEGQPHLVDPGFLVFQPVPLPTLRPHTLVTAFNRLLLVPRPNMHGLELYSIDARGSRLRLTYKTDPAEPDEFLRAWNASFGWDMMRYPLLTRAGEGGQIYLRGNRLQFRSSEGIVRSTICESELARRIAQEFGVALPIVGEALDILRRKGEHVGREARGAGQAVRGPALEGRGRPR